jgi:hypothetical protein
LKDLVNAIQPTVQTAVQYREIVLWGAGGLAAVALAQLLFILWTSWRLREIGQLRERLSRLADGLALLTDTTEAGLGTISRQIEQLGKRPAPAARASSSRIAVAKRVVEAALKGDKVSRIARDEQLSESEVRLHLALADSPKVQSRKPEGRTRPLASRPLTMTLEETACLEASTSR